MREITETEYDVTKREVRKRECPYCGDYVPLDEFSQLTSNPSIRDQKILREIEDETVKSLEERKLEDELQGRNDFRVGVSDVPSIDSYSQEVKLMKLRAERKITLGDVQNVLQSIENPREFVRNDKSIKLCQGCVETITELDR